MNSIWYEDIGAYEQERIKEMHVVANRALKVRDLECLNACCEELIRSAWQQMPPEPFVKSLTKARDELAKALAFETLKKIEPELNLAHGALDVALGRKLRITRREAATVEAEIRRLGDDSTVAADGRDFVCEYAGSMRLAKAYRGRYRIYRLVPTKVFGIEALAKAAHEAYCERALERDESPTSNVALRPWDELPEDLRIANRSQVIDIPSKLRFLGYELAPGYGISPYDMEVSESQLEELAVREHARWSADRLKHGWTYASTRDNARKHHPLLVAWDRLSKLEKDKDRDTVRDLPRLIERAGFSVKKSPMIHTLPTRHGLPFAVLRT